MFGNLLAAVSHLMSGRTSPSSSRRPRRMSQSIEDSERNQPFDALLTEEQKIGLYDQEEPYSNTSSPRSWSNSSPSSVALRLLRNVLVFLLPSFIIAKYFPDRAPPPSKVHKTAYLDGLRGVAAVSVVIFHFSTAVYPNTATAWGTRGNDGFFALPFVRLLYAGPFAVSLFFVISGFALSIKPVEYMLSGNDAAGRKLFRTLTSATFRRPIRLYLPAFVSAFAVLLILASGIMEYAHFSDYRVSVKTPHVVDRSLQPRQEPDQRANIIQELGVFRHVKQLLKIWFNGCIRMLDVFDNTVHPEKKGHPFNSPLWSIVVEFRASILLFLVQLGVSNVRHAFRILLTFLLIFFSVYMGSWEMVLFLGGFLLAQVDPLMPGIEAKMLRTPWHESLWNGFMVLLLVGGMYLGSYPDYYAREAPGYGMLYELVPDSYDFERPRFWQGIGGIFIVFAVGRLPIVAAFFASTAIRWVGAISFSLYLVHSSMLVTWGVTFLYYLWGVTGRDEPWLEGLGFFAAVCMLLPVAMWYADVFWRAVDLPSVKFARWLEDKVSLKRD